MDLSGPFRGSVAVACGALTRGVLAGPGYRRLFTDVYAPARLAPDLTLRSRAALLLVEPDGALSGYSAAELLGASCAPADAPAEVTCPRSLRRRPGLLAHRDPLHPTEIVQLGGLRMTSPERTAYDLARQLALVEAVAAVDALAHRHPFPLDAVRALRSRHLGAPGNRAVEPVLALVDRRSESPMESRIRVHLVLGGLHPDVQFEVCVDGSAHRLDLAFPAVRLGVEFDGRHHRTAAQARRDLVREASLANAGWTIIRFDAGTVLHRPWRIVAATRAACHRAVIASSAHIEPTFTIDPPPLASI